MKLWKKAFICFLFFKYQPETFGNVGVLFLLLDHQTALPPHRGHGVHDGQLGDLRVEVVQPELVHRDEGPGPSDSGAAVDKNCPRRICPRRVLVSQVQKNISKFLLTIKN